MRSFWAPTEAQSPGDLAQLPRGVDPSLLPWTSVPCGPRLCPGGWMLLRLLVPDLSTRRPRLPLVQADAGLRASGGPRAPGPPSPAQSDSILSVLIPAHGLVPACSPPMTLTPRGCSERDDQGNPFPGPAQPPAPLALASSHQ